MALFRSPTGPVARDLHQRGNRVVVRARQLVPVDQGTLKGSIHMEKLTVGGMPAVRIGSNLHYAIYVHEGTGVYAGRGYIYPKSGSFLRWPNKNQSGAGRRRYRGGATESFVFARKVKGMKGTPYLRDALDAAR